MNNEHPAGKVDFHYITDGIYIGTNQCCQTHCKNGHGRAPTLVSAYLISKGKSPEEAEAFIKSKRPTMHLDRVQREALQNFNRKQ